MFQDPDLGECKESLIFNENRKCDLYLLFTLVTVLYILGTFTALLSIFWSLAALLCLFIWLVQVVVDRISGRSRGFGFVTFDDEKAMDEAIRAMDGMNLDGRSITVDKAQPQSSGRDRDDRDYDRGRDRGGRDRDYGGGRGSGGGECFKCGKHGHFARECPSAQGTRGDRYGGKSDRYSGSGGGGGNSRYGPDRGGDRYSGRSRDGGGRSGSGGDRYNRDRSGPYERPSSGYRS